MQSWGAAYWKARFKRERREMTGGLASVKSLEDRVVVRFWKVRRSLRYSGLEVVMILYVIESTLYVILSVILSQCRDFNAGDIRQCLDFR